jgi:hypothetical protein
MHVDALPVAIVAAVFVALVAGLVALYRYTHTESWRHGEVRRATFELLLVIGPFFGVHPKHPEPEPTSVSTPKGDSEDPNAARFRVGGEDSQDSADQHPGADGGK